VPKKPPDEPPDAPIDELREEALGCRRCDLWKPATQTVFGEGPETARVMVIGEAPGNEEDQQGRPFVGPAGRLLDRALAEAGLDRSEVYVTNTVKHFKFVRRGKRRIHDRANRTQQQACSIWLLAELARVRPRIVVCLGAMAAQAMFGAAFRVTTQRGQWLALDDGARGIATVHPSALLRIPDEDERRETYAAFVTDLRKVKKALSGPR
jgi:uracil-DNA glycosylase family protein